MADRSTNANGHKPRHIALSVTDGRTIRDLFYNGFLDLLQDAGFSMTIFCEAVGVPAFVEEWKRPGVEFSTLLPHEANAKRRKGVSIRGRVAKLGNPSLMQAWMKCEEKWFCPPRREYMELFARKGTSLVLATHAHVSNEAELITSAHAMGIPTLGVVRSWDNVYKGLRCRPQRLAVWSEINKQEVVDKERYDPSRIHLMGAPQFDPYFSADTRWPREQLAAKFDLDPNRPIIVFGTQGYFFPGFDETWGMDMLLDALDKGLLPGNPQIILRLHPWSRLEHFQKYAKHPAVRLSYVDRYWPALTWYMTREDMVLVANMLMHADVVITPGSTLTLEAAIFDRPTVVPICHPYQPERAEDYFSTWVLGKHFGRIEKLDLVPIIKDGREFPAAVKRALEDPSWYREQRQRLVKEYVHFTDGNSTRRLAELTAKVAANGKS